MSVFRAKTTSRRVTSWLAAAAALFLLVTGYLGTPLAVAAPGQASLDVQQVISGVATASDSFTFELLADKPSFPLPNGASNGVYTFVIAGNATMTIGPIAFAEPGIYTYQLRCTTASSEKISTDQQVYAITFYAEAPSTVATVVQLPDGAKTSQILFTQVANHHDQAAGPQTGDDSNPVLWTGLLAGSAILLALLVWLGRRSEHRPVEATQ